MKSIRDVAILSVALAAGIGLFAGSAEAAEVTFTGNYSNLTGTGNGGVLGVLSLQQQGNDDFEWGYSGWADSSLSSDPLFGTGGSAEHETFSSSNSQKGTSTSSSGYYAQSVGTLAAAGINGSNLAVVFQTNCTGNALMTIRKFSVVFINADGSLVGKLTYTPTNTARFGTAIDAARGGANDTFDDGILNGTGQGTSGWLYTLDLSSILAINPNFFSQSGNRVGMEVTQYVTGSSGQLNFTPTEDGADNFFFSTATAPPVITPFGIVPLPSAAWMGLGMLGLIGGVQIVRRRRLATA